MLRAFVLGLVVVLAFGQVPAGQTPFVESHIEDILDAPATASPDPQRGFFCALDGPDKADRLYRIDIDDEYAPTVSLQENEECTLHGNPALIANVR